MKKEELTLQEMEDIVERSAYRYMIDGVVIMVVLVALSLGALFALASVL